MARTYWIDLFTIETWKEFLEHGGDVTGFSEKRWATVQRMKPVKAVQAVAPLWAPRRTVPPLVPSGR